MHVRLSTYSAFVERHHPGKSSHREGSNTPGLTIHHCGENVVMGFAQYIRYF